MFPLSVLDVEKGVKNSLNLTVSILRNMRTPRRLLRRDLQSKSREEKKNIQLANKLKEEELRALFNDGLSNQFGKKKTSGAAVAKELGVDEQLIDIDGLDLGSSSESEEEDGVDHGDTGGGAPPPR